MMTSAAVCACHYRAGEAGKVGLHNQNHSANQSANLVEYPNNGSANGLLVQATVKRATAFLVSTCVRGPGGVTGVECTEAAPLAAELHSHDPAACPWHPQPTLHTARKSQRIYRGRMDALVAARMLESKIELGRLWLVVRRCWRGLEANPEASRQLRRTRQATIALQRDYF